MIEAACVKPAQNKFVEYKQTNYFTEFYQHSIFMILFSSKQKMQNSSLFTYVFDKTLQYFFFALDIWTTLTSFMSDNIFLLGYNHSSWSWTLYINTTDKPSHQLKFKIACCKKKSRFVNVNKLDGYEPKEIYSSFIGSSVEL